jgi:hypothetical protein
VENLPVNKSWPEEILLTTPGKQKPNKDVMNILKKIGLLLLVLGVGAGFVHAAEKTTTTKTTTTKTDTSAPDGTIKISSGSVALGVGWSWGKGTLTYKGKDYPLSVKGLSIGKVGITGSTASGEVHNLKSLKDFDGNYTAVGAGITVAGGRSAVTMSNQNGVRVRVISTNRGVDLTLGGGGVDLKIKK